MIDAPVGIQCPVCAGRMREGALGEREYRTRVRLERSPTFRRLQGRSLTGLLVGANVVIAVLMFLTGAPTSRSTLIDFGALITPLPSDQWWRVFTAMFVHIGLFHLAFNMIALYLFGQAIEARYGKIRFLALYLASGLLGSGASLAFTSGGVRAGASGGVFGILGAWLAFYVLHRRAAGAGSQIQSLAFLIGLNLFIGFTAPGIDNAAHIGGLVAGFLVGGGLELARRRAAGWKLAAPAAYGVVILIAVLFITPNTF